MALNIKNQKTCDLARELAELTDDTMTGAITVALESQLEQVRRQRQSEQLIRDLKAIRKRDALLEDIDAISERCSKLIDPGFKSTDHGDLLYDEYGLPK